MSAARRVRRGELSRLARAWRAARLATVAALRGREHRPAGDEGFGELAGAR